MSRSTWTKDELTFLKENYQYYFDNEMAELLPRHSPKSIETKRQRLGLKRGHYSKYSFQDFKTEIQKRGYELVSVESEYKNACTKLKYICPMHKEQGVQEITLGQLINGQGCRYCAHIKSGLNRRIDIDSLVLKDAQRCQELNFTYLNTYRKDNKYGHSKIWVDYICNNHTNHGVQSIPRLALYLLKEGCQYCSGKNRTVEDLNMILREKTTNIKILDGFGNLDKPNLFECECCGHKWLAYWGVVKYCPMCNPKRSFGESLVKKYLDSHDIEYIEQFRFKNCKNIYSLPFDFYLPKHNVCIEYQGKQHFQSVDYFGGEEAFEKRKVNDGIKEKYCIENSITLIKIPYTIDSDEKVSSHLSNLLIVNVE